MAKSFLKLDTRRPTSDGKYPIKIGVGYGTDIYLSTGIECYPEEWDDESRLYTGRNAKRINDFLDTMLSRIKNRILDLRETGALDALTNKRIRSALTDTGGEIPQPDIPSLGDMFRRVIGTKGARNAELFTQTLRKLETFCDVNRVTFEQITKLWLTDFDNSLHGLSVNSRAIHLRNLRNVINYAIDEGYTQNYPFRRYHIKTEATPMRVVPVGIMRQYAALEHLNKRYEEYRDMFLLMVYLIGINLVDFSALTKDNIVGDRLEYRRAKTGHLYSILLQPEALVIIKKYKGKKHLVRCFDRYKNYKDYMKHINSAMQMLGPVKVDTEGKYIYNSMHWHEMDALLPEVTSYWTRYSWATYAAELDIPKDTISEALGHEYGSRITGVYIKYNRDKVDEANRKVIDYILYNKKE